MTTNPQAINVLCYGDSNTYGVSDDDTKRLPVNVRWTGQLQKILGDEFNIIEEGLPGRTTNLSHESRPSRNGELYLLPCLNSHKPLDMVVLMLGTNDFKTVFNRSAEEVAIAINELLNLINTHANNQVRQPAKVILISPIYIDDTTPLFQEVCSAQYNHDSVEKSHQLAAAMKVIAEQNGCAFLDASTVAQPGQDGIHLTKESHEPLAQLIANAVKATRID